MVDSVPTISLDSINRTSVEVIQSRRRMKFLTISTTELENISSINTHVTAFFSGMTFCISMILAIAIGGIFTGLDKLDSSGKLLFWGGGLLALCITIFCLIMGVMNILRKNKIITTIEEESGESS